MTEIEGSIGPFSGKFKSSTSVVWELKPCTPVIKVNARLLRPDDMVSFHADPEGKVSATRVRVTEDGELEQC